MCDIRWVSSRLVPVVDRGRPEQRLVRRMLGSRGVVAAGQGPP
ncbi:hypothetical protein ACFWP2_17240 [Kitasatospora sp. NPDC058444]